MPPRFSGSDIKSDGAKLVCGEGLHPGGRNPGNTMGLTPPPAFLGHAKGQEKESAVNLELPGI